MTALTTWYSCVFACGEFEADLAAAVQLDIDLGQQFRIEQRAVPGAVRAVDAITGAQRVERILGTGMAHPRHGDGIDHPAAIERGKPAAREFGIDKAEIEAGIVGNQRGIAEKCQQVVHPGREQRLVGQEGVTQPMHRFAPLPAWCVRG